MQAAANGIGLEYESFGNTHDPLVILIMGLGGQLLLWPTAFCETLAAGGYHVVRFDNRDIGLSTRIESAGRPNLLGAGLRAMLGLRSKAPYTLNDMADDTIGLLDALGAARAHIVGASMGGMIAQLLAVHHLERVRSLNLIMTSSGDPSLPQADLKLQLRLLKKPPSGDREALIRFAMQTWRLIGSPGYRSGDAELRAKVEASIDRAHYPVGMARQLAAILASGSRAPLLGRISAPTLIVHGEDDPLIPPAAAHDLARRINGARLELIPGMGHDLPTPLLPVLATQILSNLRRA